MSYPEPMSEAPYKPSPIDTAAVTLTPELNALVDILARNTHEVWAWRRVRDGWRHGPERSDRLKTTPMLVPYDELPETEREYDRSIVREVLKALIARGYDIQPPGR